MTIVKLEQHGNRQNWSVDQSRKLYRINTWSDGYFDINNEGHIIAQPGGNKDHSIDIFQLINELRQQNYPLPLLIRFSDILKQRLDNLCTAFAEVMENNTYTGTYTAVYPIKVNQQRRVIEDIISHGAQNIGLEAGSKPELLIIIALARQNSIVICNGYKDREYIRLALIGQQLGLRVFIVIEKLSELNLIINTAQEMQITPRLGIRIRLTSVAAGKWQNTGGEKSKFGLHSIQIMQAVEKLNNSGLLNNLELIHFHVGSQVSNIQEFKRALAEGARFFAELKKLGAPIDYIDAGGGIGIDYDGTQSQGFNSINYSLHSYAETVVHTIKETCQQYKLDHPAIITESGRAMTAHHAVLVTNLIDVESAPGISVSTSIKEDVPSVVKELWQIYNSLDEENGSQRFYEADQVYEKAREMYLLGLLDLEHRARIEEIYFSVCRKILQFLNDDQKDLKDALNVKLADKYFCNFSLFQSIPDSWAIGQVFPIVPIHRLDEIPGNRAVINDLTCDSDGCIKLYVDSDGVDTSLPVHNILPGEPYFIGIFLVGAYQEILGDMHNLFGDTASINIEMNDNGEYTITEYHSGDTVADLLDYVHIDIDKLGSIYKNKIENNGLTDRQKQTYHDELLEGLRGYTYLED